MSFCINLVEIKLFIFSISPHINSNVHIPYRSSATEREISCHARLCSLAGLLCFVMLVPGVLVAQNHLNRENVTMVALAGEGEYEAGSHSLIWDASASPAGVYFVKVSTTEGAHTSRVVLIR